MWNAKCDTCTYTADAQFQGDLILPVSAHRIETSHVPFTITGEDEVVEVTVDQ